VAGDRTVLPLPTPQLDKLAKQGGRYNNFHTEPGASGLNAGAWAKAGRRTHRCFRRVREEQPP